MIERARMMIYLCENIAQARDLSLYGEDGQLPLPHNILDYFLHYIETCMDNEDVNQRAIARLVAEAFHDHQGGLDYLYLHSKVFKSNRPLTLKT